MVMPISIHAPREGSDGGDNRDVFDLQAISIHAPREGSDQDVDELADRIVQFLSTLPARGATCVGVRCGGQVAISIHAPREGSDRNSSRRAQ